VKQKRSWQDMFRRWEYLGSGSHSSGLEVHITRLPVPAGRCDSVVNPAYYIIVLTQLTSLSDNALLSSYFIFVRSTGMVLHTREFASRVDPSLRHPNLG